jgi:hypothetical protein
LSDADSSEATIDELTLEQAVHNLNDSVSYLQSIYVSQLPYITMSGDHLNANVTDNESFGCETRKSPDNHDDDDDDIKKADYLYSQRANDDIEY